jgi:hypothetical protein
MNRLVVVLTALVLLPSSARASGWEWMGSYGTSCGSSFTVCASLEVGTLPLPDGGTKVIFRVRNLQGWVGTAGENAPMVGLEGGPVYMNFSAGSFEGGDIARADIKTRATGGAKVLSGDGLSSDLHVSRSLSGGGWFTFGFGGIWGCDSPGWGVTTCGPNGWFVMSFDVDWSLRATDLDGVSAGCYNPAVDPESNYECDAFGAGGFTASRTFATRVPEPTTVLLFGWGLLGIGITGVRRRGRETG